GDVQIMRPLAEPAAGAGLEAVDAVAELDDVEIEPEDAPLGQGSLEPPGEHGLDELAGEGALAAEEEVLGHLLRDRRAATLHATLGHVHAQGQPHLLE